MVTTLLISFLIQSPGFNPWMEEPASYRPQLEVDADAYCKKDKPFTRANRISDINYKTDRPGKFKLVAEYTCEAMFAISDDLTVEAQNALARDLCIKRGMKSERRISQDETSAYFVCFKGGLYD